MARGCQNPRKPRPAGTWTTPKKGKELVTHIKAMINNMDPEDALAFKEE